MLYDQILESHGWPRRAMYSELRTTQRGMLHRLNATTTLHWGVAVADIPFARSIVPHKQAVLPLRPIWPGLLANTAIFAAPWAVLLFGVPLARRAVRRKRGLCEGCGYSRRGLPAGTNCPECGLTHR